MHAKVLTLGLAELIHLPTEAGAETIARLRAQVARLQARLIVQPATATIAGRPHYRWIEFVTAGTARIKKNRGFQQAFLEANPAYNAADLVKWRRYDTVPAAAMSLIATLEYHAEPGRGQDWTPVEYQFLADLLARSGKLRMDTLAEKLSGQFGRTITVGAAKGAKARVLLAAQGV
jgi:hypothetical protein